MAVGYNPRTVTDGLVSLYDAANPKSFSPNTFVGSLDIYSWYVARRGGTTIARGIIEQDNTTSKSPAGGIPLKMNIIGNDSYLQSYNSAAWNISQVQNGQTWTVSVYVKANVATTCELYLFGANSSGVAYVNDAWIDIANKEFSVTNEWTRIEHQITFSNADVAYIHMRLDGPQSGGIGQTLWWDGLQVELAPTATKFNSKYNANRNNWWDVISGYNLINYGYPTYDSNGYFTLGNNATNYMMNSSYPFPTDDHTIECWFRSVFTNAQQTPYTYSVAGDNAFLLLLAGATTIRPYSFNSNPDITVPNLQNRWVCFTRTRVRSTGVEYYYLNGVQVGTRTNEINTAATTNGYLIIGQEADSPGGGFDPLQNLDGDFSRLSIYNKSLSSEQIMQNFSAMRGRYGI